MTPVRGRRWEWLWAPALYMVVVAVLYREVWLPVNGRLRWFGWDCIESYWPDLAYFARSLRAREWPMWNPYDRGGYPFYGDTVVGLYYPVSWFFAVLGAAAGTLGAWAIQVKALFHLAAAGASMHAYLRSRGLSRAAAIFGGATWIVSGPMIMHKASALLWPMVWAPLVWIAIDRLVERVDRAGGWRRAAALAGAIALSGLSGPPPGFFYILLFSLGYGVWRGGLALARSRAENRLRADARAFGVALAVCAGVSFALLAVTVVPAGTVVAESPRAARSLAYSLSNPLPVGPTLVGFVAPWATRCDVYFGIIALALVFAALVIAPRADRGAPVFFFASAILAFCLAFGGGTPLLPFLVKHAPGFGLFREAARYKVLAGMLGSVVAAHGLEALVRVDAARRRRVLTVVLAVFASFAFCALAVRLWHPGAPQRLAATLSFLGGGAVLATVLVFARGRMRALLSVALAVLACVDVAVLADELVRITEAPPDDQEDRRFLAGLGDVGAELRVYDEFVMEQRPGSRLGVRDFRGYPSGDPFEDVRYQDILRRATTVPQILEAFNVAYVLHGPHHRNQKETNYVKTAPSRTSPGHFRVLDGKRFPSLHPVPLVAWYEAATLVDGKGAALDALEKSEDSDGVRRAAVVERADVPKALRAQIEQLAAVADPRPLAPGQARHYAANQIVAQIDAPARGLVVLNEKMFTGWQVTVDGRPAVPLRANVLLRGVMVDGPGPHTIVWTFAPRGYRWLVALWFLGVGVLLAAAVSWRRSRAQVSQ